MIDIRCTREGYECEGCCIKDKCDNLEQTNQVNLWEIYQQGRANAIDELVWFIEDTYGYDYASDIKPLAEDLKEQYGK